MATFTSQKKKRQEEAEKEELEKKLIEEIESDERIFSVIPMSVIKNELLKKHDSAFKTFAILNVRAGGTGVTFASNKTIQAEHPEQTDKVIRDNLRILIEAGVVYRVLKHKNKRGTQRYLVFVGTWRLYFERCIKLGLFEEAARVQSFFEQIPFDLCYEEIQKKFTTSPSRAVNHQPMNVCSIKQKNAKEKENNKESQNPFPKTSSKHFAAASPRKVLSLEERLVRNLGKGGAKRALDYWNSLTEDKQKSTRNIAGYLTKAIREEWDKEKPQEKKEKNQTFKPAKEVNRELALEVNKLLKPIDVNTHFSKDYFEVYSGSWNKVFCFKDSNRSFKMQASLLLEKFGIKIPDFDNQKQSEGVR